MRNCRVYQCGINPLLHQLLQLLPEGVHLSFLDRLRWHFKKLAGRHYAFITLRECGEDSHAFVTVAIRTLHDRAVDVPFLDAAQRVVLLIEADNSRLSEFAGFLYGFVDLRRVVTEKSHEAAEIRMARK